MKFLKFIITNAFVFSLAFMMSGCNDSFFNQVPNDRLTIDEVFQKRKYSEDYLATVYSYIQDESAVSYNIPWDPCSDDMDESYDRAGYNTYPMNLGNWSASSNYFNNWSSSYKGIRSATYFMQHIDQNQEMIDNGEFSRIKQYKSEARFLRAYFYYCLLRQYGPFIILGDDIIAGDLSNNDPFMNKQRNSYDECVNYICNQMDSAALNLPTTFTDQQEIDYGRATKAMCMAIKNRVLMLVASPQFNGNVNYKNVKNPDGSTLFSQSYDQSKWEKAAKSAKDIIDLGVFSLYKVYNKNGDLDPYRSCRDVFLDPWNSEAIMYRTYHDFINLNRHGSPRYYNGYESMGITQMLVDEFEMKNGKAINEIGSGYQENGFSTSDYKDPVTGWVFAPANTYMMYVNREPRFYVDVAFNGAYCLYNNQADKYRWQLYFTGADGKKGSWDFPRTGYVRIKGVSPAYNAKTGKNTTIPYLMIRYAEILLNYVEALNEYNPENPDILKYLNMIRERAGLPGIEEGLNQAKMRENIRHERRVELCEENIRYFDTRRWLIAEQTDGGPFYGMNVDAGNGFDTNTAFYQRTVFETRVFRKNYYLFPIPQSEINKNKNLVQNPGW